MLLVKSHSGNGDVVADLVFGLVNDLDRDVLSGFGEVFPVQDDFARFGIVFGGNPFFARLYGDGVAVGDTVVAVHHRNLQDRLAEAVDDGVGPVGESERGAFFVIDVGDVAELVRAGATLFAAGLLAEDEPVAASFAEPVQRGGALRVLDANIPVAEELQSLRVEFQEVQTVGACARDREDADSGVDSDRDTRNFLGKSDIANLAVPVDALLVPAVREYGDGFVYSLAAASRFCAGAILDSPDIRVGFDNLGQ